MKELKEYFIGIGEVKGFIFTQIKKSDYAFIYKVVDQNRVTYEVFERRVNKKWNCISYPKSKSFGVWAWSKLTIEKALLKFEEVNARKEVLDARGV